MPLHPLGGAYASSAAGGAGIPLGRDRGEHLVQGFVGAHPLSGTQRDRPRQLVVQLVQLLGGILLDDVLHDLLNHGRAPSSFLVLNKERGPGLFAPRPSPSPGEVALVDFPKDQTVFVLELVVEVVIVVDVVVPEQHVLFVDVYIPAMVFEPLFDAVGPLVETVLHVCYRRPRVQGEQCCHHHANRQYQLDALHHATSSLCYATPGGLLLRRDYPLRSVLGMGRSSQGSMGVCPTLSCLSNCLLSRSKRLRLESTGGLPLPLLAVLDHTGMWQ